jgi:hypothetical protein
MADIAPDKITAFCAVLADTAQVKKACQAIGVSRTTAYAWRKQDLQFALAWDEAIKIAVSGLEDEAIRRAHEGVDEPLIHQGQFSPVIDYDAIDPLTGESYIPALAPIKRHANGAPVYATVKKFSDSLLTFLLKAHAPAKYGDKQGIELTGAGGGPVQFNDTEKALRIAVLVSLAKSRAAGDVSDLV